MVCIQCGKRPTLGLICQDCSNENAELSDAECERLAVMPADEAREEQGRILAERRKTAGEGR